MCNQAQARAAHQQASEPAKAPLPINEMPGATFVSVDDGKGKRRCAAAAQPPPRSRRHRRPFARLFAGNVAAVGGLIRYSAHQAYFVLQHLDGRLKEKAVSVSTPDVENAPLKLRIEKVLVSASGGASLRFARVAGLGRFSVPLASADVHPSSSQRR